ncbi:piggyBac transposable element-derived protein 4-like [Bradysia coprophila]|uniref:piggyBac transposable element-derived protein 4-like n=1 Tax=Bradysia coprophila TaxID=38358 RepID=UPI00187DA031|nr:piggyBac transposable element-derived protein 4-like [Bradysia coprophila]
MAKVQKGCKDYFTDTEESDFEFSESDESDSDDDSEFLLESEEESFLDEQPKSAKRSIPKKAVIPKRQPYSRLPQKPLEKARLQNESNSRSRNVKDKQNLSTHEWTSERAPPPMFEFNETPGLKLPSGICDTPSQFIDLFLDDTFLELLVVETNKYAKATIEAKEAKGELKPHSRLKAWTDTNREEMKIFLGLFLHMGALSLPSIPHYWCENELYKTSFWRDRMSRNRFQLILRFLHFADNLQQNDDRLYKINPVLHHFNSTMNKIYSPKRELCIDESMVLWRGRLLFRQYMKDKRHPYGIKLYELCESSGIVLKIQIYAGKSTATITTEEGTSVTAQVVLDLMDGFLYKGHILYTDNFYNSVPLTKTLTSKSTYLCGTLRSNRKENPKEVVKQKLMRGELSYLRSDSVIVCKWRDKRDVLTISNMHEVELVDVPNRNGKISTKPNIIRDYNLGMGGIDRADQMMSYYSSERKTVRWYKKLGIHFIEAFIQNAYWMHMSNHSDEKTSLLDFREIIVKHLAGKPTKGVADQSQNCKGNKLDNRTGKFHYLDSLPPTKNKQFPTKQCAQCSKNKRKETRYFCPVCPEQPALCVVNCFKEYHLTHSTKKN